MAKQKQTKVLVELPTEVGLNKTEISQLIDNHLNRHISSDSKQLLLLNATSKAKAMKLCAYANISEEALIKAIEAGVV